MPKDVKELENNRNVMTTSLGHAFELTRQMLTNMPPDECPAIVFVGSTGLGKTEGLTNLVGDLDYDLVIRHLSQVHPLDLGGVGLDAQSRELYFAKPPLYTEVMESKAARAAKGKSTKSVVFLDEIDRVQPIGQNAIMQMLSERKQNGFKMPDTYVVAAANAWYAQYTYELDKAVASRLCIMHVESNTDQWIRWALDHKVHPSVITCISIAPDILNQHIGGQQGEGAIKLADPRAWYNLSNALNHGVSADSASMFVGEFAAQKFGQALRFLTEYKDEIRQVLKGELLDENAKLTENAKFGIYLAAAGQVKTIEVARKYLPNSRKQLGDEKAYVAGRLITYNIPMQELSKDPTCHKHHMDMLAEQKIS